MPGKNLAGSGRDDGDLNAEPSTPSQSGSSGGTLAIDIGSEDEEKTALGGDPEPTRVTKQDKVQSRIPTRSDHESAAG
ncbi:hypothetical protein GG804_22090 [Sphingomonas histidinilytica]|uniref:hypothetical protein n=1 Tax=Rhizorhabdus histidinilytica TaxID=439228 RepID=UPI001AD97D01|nr:hypothetical protein [Rhizorhabdus histidinilytica]MBO9379466.1 hypothetical protein [Rhizorhabdus histidinilytica]